VAKKRKEEAEPGRVYTKEMHEAYVAEQEKKHEAEEQARRERLERQEAQRAWKQAGSPGSLASFTKDYAQAKSEDRARGAVEEGRRAREQQRRSRTSRI